MGIYEYSDIFMNTNNHECLGSDPALAEALVRELQRMLSQYHDRLGKVAMFLALRLYLENMETLTDSLESQRSPLSMIQLTY